MLYYLNIRKSFIFIKSRLDKKLKIYLSEEKAKKNNIDLDEWYQKIDKYFKSRGVEIVSKGIYKGVRKDFGTFVTAQMQLPDTNGF